MPLSLLSMQMDQELQSRGTVAGNSSSSIPSSGAGTSIAVVDCERHERPIPAKPECPPADSSSHHEDEQAEQPPESLRHHAAAGDSVKFPLLSRMNEGSTSAAGFSRLSLQKMTSVPLASASLLTASSLRELEQEYDRDTWRLYNRIRAARTSFEDSHTIMDEHAMTSRRTAAFGANNSKQLELVSDDASSLYQEETIFGLDMEE